MPGQLTSHLSPLQNQDTRASEGGFKAGQVTSWVVFASRNFAHIHSIGNQVCRVPHARTGQVLLLCQAATGRPLH